MKDYSILGQNQESGKNKMSQQNPDYPFDLKVYIYQRPFLRDEDLNAEMYIDYRILEQIFDRMETDRTVKKVYLSFPERWLNIIEQRTLLKRLQLYCPCLEDVTIKTHSVYIIQTTKNTSAYIVKVDTSIPQEEDIGKLYCENIGNIFDLSKINVV